MLIALDDHDNRIQPLRNKAAFCPHCKQRVISKCGDIIVWHWAHEVKCIFDSEPETEWHTKWKVRALVHGLTIEHAFERHITDAIDLKNKYCYEFQYSPISRIDLLSRSMEYKSNGFIIKWIFDYKDKYDKDELIVTNIDEKTVKFQQKWAKRTIISIFEGNSRLFGVLFFDIGGQAILIKKLHENGNGWGLLTPYSEVL